MFIIDGNFQPKLLKVFPPKNNQGFTLIELLVVIIILGVLAAVALPNFIGQIGKARESEGKNGVGTINRAQQAYHFEKQSFTPNISDSELEGDNDLGIAIVSEYYDFEVTGGSADKATVTTSPKDGASGKKHGIRLYSGIINHSSGKYTTALCQSTTVSAAAPSVAGNSCPAGTTIK